MGKNLRNEVDQISNLDYDNVWVFAFSCAWTDPACLGSVQPPAPIFMTGFRWHFQRKIGRVSMASIEVAMRLCALGRRYAWPRWHPCKFAITPVRRPRHFLRR